MGDPTDIVYRSLKERAVMVFFDESPYVTKWGSETVVIPYKWQVDNKMHRYFVDFVADISTISGNVRKLLIEFKPHCQTKPPSKPKRETAKRKNRFIKESVTYIKNINKWEAAEKWAQKNGREFVVITEKDTKQMLYFNQLIKEIQ